MSCFYYTVEHEPYQSSDDSVKYTVRLYEDNGAEFRCAQAWSFTDSLTRTAKRRAEQWVRYLRSHYGASSITIDEAERRACESYILAKQDAADYAEDCHSGMLDDE